MQAFGTGRVCIRALGIVALLVAGNLAPAPARAHPHVFIDGGVDFLFDGSGRLVRLRVTWIYDPLTSLFILEDLDIDAARPLSPGDRARVAAYHTAWEAGYDGDSYLRDRDGPVDLSGPREPDAELRDGRVTITFLRDLDAPARTGHARRCLRPFLLHGVHDHRDATPRGAARGVSRQGRAFRADDGAGAAAAKPVRLVRRGDAGAGRHRRALRRDGASRMRLSLLLGAALAGALLVAWQAGGLQLLGWQLLGLQRELQSMLAAQVAALRAGEPHALAALLAFCAAYGFLHAVGPGHGKLLVGAAAVGAGATARRMAGIAVAGSLAQSLAAIVLIYGGLALVGATARAAVGTSEAWAMPVGNAAVAAVGAWIVVRGVRAWRSAGPAHGDGQLHRHDHSHDAHGCGCGHRHGPDLGEVSAARGLAGALALVGAMAARPCTGAMMLLAIAWSMGLPGAGAAGALAMGVGTACFTVVVALLAVLGRETALAWFESERAGRRVLPAMQIAAGLLLVTSGGALLVSTLAA